MDNNSVFSDLTSAFEEDSRKQITRAVLRAFHPPNLLIGDEANRRELLDREIFIQLSKYYVWLKNSQQGEIDCILLLSHHHWVIHQERNTFQVIGDFSLVDTAQSLNRIAQPYKKISPNSSAEDLESISSPNFYAVFEVTTGKKILEEKVEQLESQIAYLVLRYHLKQNNQFTPPKGRTQYGNWLAKETKKLIAFGGFIGSDNLTDSFKSAIIGKINVSQGYTYPCLWALQTESRLLYRMGRHMSQRIESIEENMKEMKRQNDEMKRQNERQNEEMKEQLDKIMGLLLAQHKI